MKPRVPSVLITFALVCFALVQNTRAVSPAPDGGYPGGNTAEGQSALLSLTTGGFNTAIGFLSLRSNFIGQLNTAIGAGALLANTADQITATGAGALLSNTTGSFNTANGAVALLSNTTGFSNSAFGWSALEFNTVGAGNTANGRAALQNNTTGSTNTANGVSALGDNTTGSNNVALGFEAGLGNTGNNNVYIGSQVSPAVSGESNHTYIRNIKDTTVSGAGTDTVTVDLTTGLLGHLSSSRRYKEDIQPMDKASEALFALKPVSYRYKKEIDRTQSRAFGLIAEDVAKVNPHLVACNFQGQPESVHYEMVNAMLLNEFLKEHEKVQELEKQVEKLTADLQKVSAQLEASKPASQVVNNP